MTATESEIRQAFRNLVKRFSPEANRGNPMAAARFAEINEAYSVLSNVVLRSRYDKSVLLNPDISVPLTDVAYSPATADVPPPTSQRRARPSQKTDTVESRVVTVVSQPVTTTGAQSTAKTVTVSQTAAKTVAVTQTSAKTEPHTAAEKPTTQTPTETKSQNAEKKDEGRAIVDSISERAASMREAFEKAAAQLAAKREAERKARENRHADEAEKKKQTAAAMEEQQKKAQADRERREAAARELVARREREKKERAEREALEKARKEAARLKQTQSAQKRDDVKARMQSLMSQLGAHDRARGEAVAKAEKTEREREAAIEAAKPVPVADKSVKAWTTPKEAVAADPASFEAFRIQTDRQIDALKQAIAAQNKKVEEQAALIRTLAEQLRNNRGNGNYAALNEKVDQMSATLLSKIRETEAAAEAASATAALKVAQAQQLQDEVRTATERLDVALKDLSDVKQERDNLRSEMEIESAARQRAESAVAGAKQAARAYKEESERAARRATEERNARRSAERMFTAEAKARKRAEEQSKSDREAVMHMSREITLLRMAKEKAEARIETTRAQITKAAAAAEREKLAKLEEQQRKHIAEITEKLQNAESAKRELETQVDRLQTRLTEQKELDRKIAAQMTEFEQFTGSMSQADEQRLIADWEAKVRADIMLFKDTMYGTLGVPYYATPEEIGSSAQKLSDRYAVREGDDRYDRIAAVEEARDTLSDPVKRAAYNAKIGLKPEEITAALKARACYEEIVRKLGRQKATKAFWDEFDALAYDAQTGDPAAQNKLGEAFYDGVLMPADAEQAVFWFKEAAKQLYPAALFNMGMCLLNGYGVERDEGRGRGFIKKAAMVGFGPAAELVESPEFKRALRDDYAG